MDYLLLHLAGECPQKCLQEINERQKTGLLPIEPGLLFALTLSDFKYHKAPRRESGGPWAKINKEKDERKC